MPTTEERLAALEKQMAAWIDQQPTTYYTHQYSGEEIDDAVDKIRSGAGEGAVRYDQAQTLTPAQQEQAQHNIGTTWPCNPNLLDNWYFGNPVNQRGQTELASGNWSTYFIDRWVAAAPGCAYAITDDGIKISKLPHQYQQIWLQKMERMEKRTYTLSFFLKDIGLRSMTFTPQGSDSTEQTLDGGFIVSFTSEANLKNPVIRLLTSASVTVSEVTILAAKLELGPTQTLAHREGDKWVLNEVPDYGEQLRRCQRYLVYFTKFTSVSGRAANANSCQFVVPIPVTLRDKPVISDTNITNWRVQDAAGKYITITGIHAYPSGVQPSYITIFVDSAAAFTAGAIYTLSRIDAAGPVSLSADL